MKFTIGRKIGFGFGVLIFLTLVAFILTVVTLLKSKKINDDITDISRPSVSKLEKLNLLVHRSKELVSNWVFIQSPPTYPDKRQLDSLIAIEYPTIKKEIELLTKTKVTSDIPQVFTNGINMDVWEKADIDTLNTIFRLTEILFKTHREEVMDKLNSFTSYEDPNIFFFAREQVEDGDIDMLTRTILKSLRKLIKKQQEKADQISEAMQDSFITLQNVVIILGIALPVGGILIALFTVQTIVRPIDELKKILQAMSRGVLPEDKIKDREDEIGEMSVALNGLIDSMKLTTEFANEVGSGNFDSYYKPLSNEDTLGFALLKMREDLRENERVLEAKVIERTEEVVRQKEEIEIQNQKLEVLYKHVTDSIRYAKRLQEAILPPNPVVRQLLPQSFILYKPKDIVSGDFYWMQEKEGKTIVAAVDCTGHGVPGAFMSIVGNNMLNQVVKENNVANAGEILDKVNKLAGVTIKQTFEDSTVRDGMDLTLCVIDFENQVIDFAGANNPLYMFRDNEFTEIKGDKFPIGSYVDETPKNFTNHRVSIRKGDTVYIFSDGYADQFGGPRGKKFMVNQFRNLLANVQHLPMEEQKIALDKTIEEWRGNLEQVDDILVIGFRI